MENVRHIRKSTGAPDRRIGRLHRSVTAETMCGAPVTDKDMTLRDAFAALKAGWNVCPACVARVQKYQNGLNRQVKDEKGD